ncbi:hypothetical protein X756_24140 [Mesorhizobium sp. LSHC412B00]|nr:hypothetical protein X756_24140 [Mesorhizobium sp. LSHC412B00]
MVPADQRATSSALVPHARNLRSADDLASDRKWAVEHHSLLALYYLNAINFAGLEKLIERRPCEHCAECRQWMLKPAFGHEAELMRIKRASSQADRECI